MTQEHCCSSIMLCVIGIIFKASKAQRIDAKMFRSEALKVDLTTIQRHAIDDCHVHDHQRQYVTEDWGRTGKGSKREYALALQPPHSPTYMDKSYL